MLMDNFFWIVCVVPETHIIEYFFYILIILHTKIQYIYKNILF